MNDAHHAEMIARRKIGDRAGFQFYRWECIGDDMLLTGCVCDSAYTRGPRKGKPKYDGRPIQAIVSDGELKAERLRYEAETGRCSDCLGIGKTIASAGKGGTTYRACSACQGTGKATSHQSIHAVKESHVAHPLV
jgi:hypothetical protein